jgi:hypothetical protein
MWGAWVRTLRKRLDRFVESRPLGRAVWIDSRRCAEMFDVEAKRTLPFLFLYFRFTLII